MQAKFFEYQGLEYLKTLGENKEFRNDLFGNMLSN